MSATSRRGRLTGAQRGTAAARRRAPGWGACFAVAVAAALAPSSGTMAAAATRAPTVHPIYAHVQDAPQNELALQRFTTATRRFGLGPVEIVDVEGDPTPAVADKVRAGQELIRKLDFDPGRAALNDAAAVVASSGGAGLSAAALSDLFFFRAWATGRFDFNPEHVPAPAARAQAYGDLVRAASLAPGRAFNPQQFPPLLLEDWARAAADAAARPQRTLIVHAAPEATVTCDGGAPVPGPATFVGLIEGEHLIHVDEPGWAAWGAVLAVGQPTVEVQVPARRALTLDDALAAAHARRMGARFALVGEPRPGRDGGLSLSLRLIDAAGARQDAAIEPLAGDAGALDAAVMRLDEQARRLDPAGSATTAPSTRPDLDATAAALPPPVLVAAPSPQPRLSEEPRAWAHQHWPLLAAAGAMLTTVLVLSLTVGH